MIFELILLVSISVYMNDLELVKNSKRDNYGK